MKWIKQFQQWNKDRKRLNHLLSYEKQLLLMKSEHAPVDGMVDAINQELAWVQPEIRRLKKL